MRYPMVGYKRRKKNGFLVALGILIGVIGIALGLYVGIGVFFVGGIENIVNGCQVKPSADAGQIAWGAAQVLILAELVGGLIAWVGIALGAVIAGSA